MHAPKQKDTHGVAKLDGVAECPCRHEIQILKIEKDKKLILNLHNTGCTQLLIQSR
jgi:hypothetical protein